MALHSPEGPSDTGAGTLGALLYADPNRTPTSEGDWVALVRSIAAGDQLAFHAIYERTHRVVFTLIMRIVGDRHTAEEVTLDVFHDVWRRAQGYDADGGTVIGWIMNQARSRAIDRHRYEHRLKRVDPGRDAPPPTAAEAATGAVERLDRGARLRDALAVLSADERTAIESTFFGGLTHVEAAARLDQPLGTVKTHIRSGLQKLRGALREGGLP